MKTYRLHFLTFLSTVICLLLLSSRNNVASAFTNTAIPRSSSYGCAGFSVPSTHTCTTSLPFPESFYRHTKLFDSDPLDEYATRDETFDIRTTLALVGGQSILIALAAVAAAILKVPNWGFGPNISVTLKSVGYGILLSAPLGLFAAALDLIEDKVPALKDVTIATQRSVLALLGAKFKPFLGLLIATALGLAAGFGEEMLFRGILQYELGSRLGTPVAVGIASIIFGALHAVTPLYALLATIASVYFGVIYLLSDLNLIVPIAAHTFYDIVALFYAHKTVADLSPADQEKIASWDGPASKK